MSRELVEMVLQGDFVSANELLEERLTDIQEKKLYEAKRMVSAMNENTKLDKDREDLKTGKKVRASSIYQDPRERISKIERAERLKKKASDDDKAETERTRPLKKVTTAGMRAKSRAEKLARIGAAAERLKARGHSDPGRHLAAAYGRSVGKKLAPAVKFVGGALADIGSRLEE